IDSDLARRPVAQPTEIYLGDYIDRGPHPREVIDCLLERRRHRRAVFLKGNHETYLLEFIRRPDVLRTWRQYGALETLKSYGLNPEIGAHPAEFADLAVALREALPAEHERFYWSLSPFFTLGDFFFVHAGVKPGVPLAQQSERDLLWIRDAF